MPQSWGLPLWLLTSHPTKLSGVLSDFSAHGLALPSLSQMPWTAASRPQAIPRNASSQALPADSGDQGAVHRLRGAEGQHGLQLEQHPSYT